MLRNNLKMGWRNILKNRSFTLISLSSLVLGITLFFFISIWIRDEMSYDQHFNSAEQICRVETQFLTNAGVSGYSPTVGWPVGKHLTSDYPEIAHVTYLRNWSPSIKHKETYFYENAMLADKRFFDVFGYQLQAGNPATALEAPYSIVISQDLKEKYFGNEEAVGKTLLLNDTVPYKITGVFSNLSNNSHLKFDMLGSFATFCAMYPKDCEEEFDRGWFDLNVYNYVRLRSTASVPAVSEKIRNLVLVAGKERVAETGFRSTISLRPVEEIYLYSDKSTGKGTVGSIKSVRLFLAIGIFILLIACLNFINLSTAKSIDRAKEIGVQKVLGSNRGRLVFQFLTEAAFLCIIAALISVLLMIVLLPTFNQFTGKTLTIGSLFSISNLLVLTGIIALLIPLAGFYPAWVLSSFKPISVLKGSFAHTVSGTLLRKGLVVTQFVISAGFIMSTLIMWKQMQFMQQRPLGFNKENVLLVNTAKAPWGMLRNKSSSFKTTLKNAPGVTNVTACGAAPGRYGWDGQFAYPEGRSKEEALSVEYIPVDADYVKTIGLQLIAGRDFIPGSKADEEEGFIINETAVQYFGWGSAANALGKKLSTSGKDGRIIGVVKNYHQHGLQEEIRSVVLSVVPNITFFAIRYAGVSAQQVMASAEASWKEVYGNYPATYQFLDEDFMLQYQKEEKQGNFFTLAAVLSIVIGSLGLLGLVIYTAQKRVKEIGVRKVLGASAANITVLLSKDLLKLVAIAVMIAIPIAWWTMHKWLESFAYRTSISWWVFALAGMAALLIGLLTISVQAIRAALANPVKSLRTT